MRIGSEVGKEEGHYCMSSLPFNFWVEKIYVQERVVNVLSINLRFESGSSRYLGDEANRVRSGRERWICEEKVSEGKLNTNKLNSNMIISQNDIEF